MSLIMFDYDGVIADSLEIFMSGFVSACLKNGFTGLETEEDVKKLFEENVYDGMKGKGIDAQTIDNILKDFGKSVVKHVEQVKLFDGMVETLIQLGQTHELFIITSNLSEIPLKVLQKYNITSVKEVIGAEKEKSKVKKISQTIAKYPNLPAYYVGDTTGDIYEGKKAGAKTVGVGWGWHGTNKLKESSPDYLAETPEELVNLFD